MRYQISLAFCLLATFPVNSSVPAKMDVTEMASCSAAALKSGNRALWNEWLEALVNRYQSIYPAKTRAEAEQYAMSRVQDKRKRLQQKGIDTAAAFRDYLSKNCRE